MAFALLLGAAIGALAETPVPGRAGMHHGNPAITAPDATVPSGSDHQEMMAAMERMNREMTAPSAMTGDPDRDLVAAMIPHHQGAIDMARIYLRNGRDPAIRRMAQKIITDQEREIGEMRAWQAMHPAPTR